jgi:hypothetical protein
MPCILRMSVESLTGVGGPMGDYGVSYTREQKEDTFRQGQRRWWSHLWENNKVKVA